MVLSFCVVKKMRMLRFELRISQPQCEVLTTILHTPGEAGYRSQYLSHAKRALYHLSYIPVATHFSRHFLHKPYPYATNKHTHKHTQKHTQTHPKTDSKTHLQHHIHTYKQHTDTLTHRHNNYQDLFLHPHDPTTNAPSSIQTKTLLSQHIQGATTTSSTAGSAGSAGSQGRPSRVGYTNSGLLDVPCLFLLY